MDFVPASRLAEEARSGLSNLPAWFGFPPTQVEGEKRRLVAGNRPRLFLSHNCPMLMHFACVLSPFPYILPCFVECWLLARCWWAY
jgi:hypothetical protein